MHDDQLKETFLQSEEIYQGAVIHVQKWQVALPDGRQAAREIVLHLGAAAVVPVDEQGRVTLVRQHRVAIGEYTWEIPAGKLDYAGEDPLGCAKRELEEEAGLRANKWQKLTHAITTPGFCTERIALYLATELTPCESHPDQDEFLHLTTMPLSEAAAYVMDGKITDMKTCLGILMAQNILSQGLTPAMDRVMQSANRHRAQGRSI
ncbi:MAG: NUDIX hydrolase [Eubacteriales bacterium]|jgi:ADP-ribose pyrophosphatase|nr:NUDIX hydrolase [Eubacteriales bacterium]MDD4104351.1 NUDIX hydrolase [Eubacteriales bacterium]MDD4709702.1 NUDIX hydrolase [Eubacteriales bacterium]NLO15429.1 NUDIX hydrolase [Clostridiales bacterium]